MALIERRARISRRTTSISRKSPILEEMNLGQFSLAKGTLAL